MFPVLYILFLHFIADFLIQTSWQATNKSKSLVALTKHIATYAITMCIGLMVWWIPDVLLELTLELVDLAPWAAVVLLVPWAPMIVLVDEVRDTYLLLYSSAFAVATYVYVNTLLHFFTDFFTSRIASWGMRTGHNKVFWSIIGFDQFIHAFCLITTIPLLSFLS